MPSDKPRGICVVRFDRLRRLGESGPSFSRPASGLMFSCKTRGFCPTCHAKQLGEWGEWMRETLLLDGPHRQVVFTIPKMLRIFFKLRIGISFFHGMLISRPWRCMNPPSLGSTISLAAQQCQSPGKPRPQIISGQETPPPRQKDDRLPRLGPYQGCARSPGR